MVHNRRSFLVTLGSAVAALSIPARLRALVVRRGNLPPNFPRSWLDRSRVLGRLDSQKLHKALAHRDNMPSAPFAISKGARWQFVGPMESRS